MHTTFGEADIEGEMDSAALRSDVPSSKLGRGAQ